MLWALKQICAPLRYLRIAQGDGFIHSKSVYDWLLPIILSVATVTIVYVLHIPMEVFSATGLVAGIINLLNLIIAFFIAALAAVATFDRKGLDSEMKGRPATLMLERQTGVSTEHVLTHRQFICYLFGYLAFSSLFFLIFIHFVRFFRAACVVNLLRGYNKFLAIHSVLVCVSVLFRFVADHRHYVLRHLFFVRSIAGAG